MSFFKYIYYIILPAAFLCGYFAYAQAQAPASPEAVRAQPRQEKKHIIDFEDELVEGEAQKPDFFYLFQKKNFNYKRLIRLRENFIPEMRRSSEDIQRLKGGR